MQKVFAASQFVAIPAILADEPDQDLQIVHLQPHGNIADHLILQHEPPKPPTSAPVRSQLNIRPISEVIRQEALTQSSYAVQH